jgi:hypothetical protein
MTFELTGDMDSLLENLGQSSHQGFRKDFLVLCKTSDFAGLKDEYIRTYGRDVQSESRCTSSSK